MSIAGSLVERTQSAAHLRHVTRPRTPAAQFLIDARLRTEPTAHELRARSQFSRTTKGISAKELAARADLHESAVTKLESGTRPLTQHYAEKLAPALKIPVDKFPIAKPVLSTDERALLSQMVGHIQEAARLARRLEQRLAK